MYGALYLWSIICAFPIYWILVTSFKDVSIIDQAPTYLPFWDFVPSLDAWRFILGDASQNLIGHAANSLLISLCATAAAMTFGGMIIYGLTRFPSQFNAHTVMAVLLSTRILPPVVIALPLYVAGQFTGMLDSISSLICVYTAINLPVAIWMLAPALGSKASEQEEAALLDGASHMHIFFFILLPMIKTIVITVGFLVFLQCWNEYLFAAYLTFDHASTLPPWMIGQISLKEAQTGGGAEEVAHLSAAIVVTVIPVILFAIFAQRNFSKAFLNRKAS